MQGRGEGVQDYMEHAVTSVLPGLVVLQVPVMVMATIKSRVIISLILVLRPDLEP